MSTLPNFIVGGPVCGYSVVGSPASEPTAIASLALMCCGRLTESATGCDFLVGLQNADGGVRIFSLDTSPAWATGLAMASWSVQDKDERYTQSIAQAANWILSTRGAPVTQSPEFGHNSELLGWGWVTGTHSWVEPTAYALLGLAAADFGDHETFKQGVALLLDRVIPQGGWNYGNTSVLGVTLLPLQQSTAIALLALQGHAADNGAVKRSLLWLARKTGEDTPPITLAWSILALRAYGIVPTNTLLWLTAAAARVGRTSRSPLALGLLTLAGYGWPKFGGSSNGKK